MSFRSARATCSWATFEEQHHLLDVLAVRGLVDGFDAGALAALDVIEQTGAVERPLPFPDVDGAGAEREQPPDEVHRLVDAARRGIGPEVAAAVGRQLAGPLDAREVIPERDLDERVALVILEPDVEAGLVALDQVASRSSASDTVSVSVHSMSVTRSMAVSMRRGGVDAERLACQYRRTRLRRLCALPTYSTVPRASFMRYTPGWSGRFLSAVWIWGVTHPW